MLQCVDAVGSTLKPVTTKFTLDLPFENHVSAGSGFCCTSHFRALTTGPPVHLLRWRGGAKEYIGHGYSVYTL